MATRARGTIKYPMVAKILQAEVHRLKEDRKMTHSGLAAQMNMAAGQLSDVINGKKPPTRRFSLAFTAVAYPGPMDSSNRDKLGAAILEASKTVEIVRNTVREKLKEGEKLQVATVTYSPISGDDSCFFEKVFYRFLTLAGIKFDRPTPRPGDTPLNKKSDFWLGLFDSADQMLMMDRKFWRVPIRMGLNAVCLTQHQKYREEIARLLTNPDYTASISIRPIIVRDDLGWRHCVSRLRIPKEQVEELESLNVTELANSLLKGQDETTVIPVICTNEFTCTQILSQQGDRCCSVFSMNSWRVWQDSRENTRRELPQFHCSVGVDAKDFQAFVQDGLEQFLSTEIATTGEEWKNLATNLVEKVSKVSIHQMPTRSRSKELEERVKGDAKLLSALSRAHAWEWVFYTLNLSLESIKAYPNFNNLQWTPILKHGRMLVQNHLAEEPGLVEAFVELFWNSNEGKDRLCNLLDVDLGNEFRNLSHPYIVRALRRELTGLRALPIETRSADPNQDLEAALAVRRFMRSLQNVYDGLQHDEAVPKLRDEIDGMRYGKSIYGSETGAVILAQFRENECYVGGACLRLDEKREMYELRYLWVDREYRGFNIGKQIIDEAYSYALGEHKSISLEKQPRSKGLYIEILENVLPTATALFRREKFEAIGEDQGRIVMERKRTEVSQSGEDTKTVPL